PIPKHAGRNQTIARRRLSDCRPPSQTSHLATSSSERHRRHRRLQDDAEEDDMSEGTQHIAPWEVEGAAPPFAKEKVKAAAHQIFERIASGDYSFGSRLSAERNLAEQLGI